MGGFVRMTREIKEALQHWDAVTERRFTPMYVGVGKTPDTEERVRDEDRRKGWYGQAADLR